MKKQHPQTMTYEEMMQSAPKDCRPTIVDNQKEIAKIRERRAKELGKGVSELTEQEKKVELSELGLCDLDFLD